MAASTPSDPVAIGEQARSSTVRGLLSLALLLHMFIVLVVVASRSTDALIYTRLRRALFFVLPYAQTLHLDTNYFFNPTEGPPEDPEHYVQIEVRRGRDDAGKRLGQPGEGELAETVLLDDPSITPRHRRLRYINLSGFVADRINDRESEAVLPKAIAREVLRKHGKQYDAVVIYRQKLHTSPENARGPFDPMDYQEIYRGVAWYTSRGTLAYKKVEQKGRNAPTESPSKKPPRKKQPSPPPPPIDPATIPPPRQ